MNGGNDYPAFFGVHLRSIALALLIAIASVCAFALPSLAQNAGTSFSHFSTGFPLTGSHISVDCASCHASGNFKATPRQCFGCHSGSVAAGKSQNHPKTTPVCEGCHQTTLWNDIRLIDHLQATAPCADCHNGKIAVAKSPNHVKTIAPCDTCHKSTVTFALGAYAHAPTDTNCSSCHNGSTATGMNVSSHIPVGAVQCSSCHSNTAASFTSYTMDHSAVINNVSTSRCDSCHNGQFTGQGAKGAQGTASYPGHGPTGGADCITCHASAGASYASWGGGFYTHQAGDTSCANCHNGSKAIGMRTPPHIPIGAVQCSGCHSNTAATFASYTMDHSQVSGARCDSCHNGQFTAEGTKGAQGTASFPGHFPTNGRDCSTCHTSAATNFSSWAGGAYAHATTDTNCSSCHNGTTATGKTTPPHIPTTAQCGNCHTNTAASFVTYTMNHSAVTGSRCDSCHNGSYTAEGTKGAQGTASYPGHVATSGRDCITCHASAASNFTSWAGGGYVHAATDTNCSSCHNGTTATGKTTPPHIPTTAQCGNCHTNTAASFVTYTMNHSAVTGSRCDSCHNGSYTAEGTKGAQGTASYAGHVTTSGRDCITCHASAASNFTSWAGGGYVHAATDINCSNCHNGTTATGKTTPPHIPTTAQCGNCHTNTATSFVTYTMNHSAVTGSRCDSCHNGAYTAEGTKGAQGTASYSGHVATNGQDCITCHASAASNFTSWAGGGYVHQAGDINCSNCHNGTTATGKTTPPHIPTTAQCSNCHTNTATSFVTYTMNHSAVTGSRCDSCHNGSYTAEGTKGAQGTASYPGHVATNGQDCITCHASAASNFTSWAGGGYVHQAGDINCSNCHNGTTATGKTTPPHIPTTAQCSNCHTNTATSFVTYTMNHSAVTGSRCDSCHNGAYTSQGTKGAYGTASYSGHVATNGQDCITCHASAATTYTSWAGGGYVHQAGDINCSNCHNGTTATGKTTPPHIPTTAQCSNCHTNTATSFVTYTMNHSAVTGSRCDSCHNGAYTTEGTKGAQGTASYSGHVATNGQDCITCHASAAVSYVSWSGGTYVHAASDTNCSNCHNGSTAKGMTTPPHIPTVAIQCSNCHTNTATSFTTYTMNHSAVTSIRCDACHNGSYTTQGTKGAQAKPSDHPKVTQDCGCCHTSTTSWSQRQSAGTCTTTAQTPVVTVASAVKSVVSRAVTAVVRGFTGAVVGSQPTVAPTAPATTAAGRPGSGSAAPSTAPLKPPAATQPTTTGTPAPVAGTTTTTISSGAPATTGFVKPSTTNPLTLPSTFTKTPPVGSTVAAAPGVIPPSPSKTTTTAISNGATAGRGFVNPSATNLVAPAGTLSKTSPVGPTAAATPGTIPAKPTTTTTGPTISTTPATPPLGAQSMIRPSGINGAGSAATGSSMSGLTTLPAAGIRPFGSSASGITGSRFSHPVVSGGCARCHNGRDAIGKPAKHVMTNAPCENCHRSTTTFAGARVDHRSVTAACATCHTGSAAIGKPSKHVTTSAPCETCHKSTTTFAGARVDHRSVTAACATCHTGTIAIGKPPRHVVTSAPCETCHKSTTTFTGARLDHRSVTAACATCHTGTIAIGKPPRHIVTNAPCDSCHKSTVAFAGARVDHTLLTAPCASCHNGTTAPGQGPRHFTTTLPCDTCHRTTTWTSVTYRHSSPSYPNHGATISCSACHTTNAQTVAWKFPAFKPDCAACHAMSFRPQAHVKFVKPMPFYYTVNELKDCTGSCHIYTDKTLTTIQTRRSNMHRINGRGW